MKRGLFRALDTRVVCAFASGNPNNNKKAAKTACVSGTLNLDVIIEILVYLELCVMTSGLNPAWNTILPSPLLNKLKFDLNRVSGSMFGRHRAGGLVVLRWGLQLLALAGIFHTLSSLRNGCLQATKEYAGPGNLSGMKLWVSWVGQAVRFPG